MNKELRRYLNMHLPEYLCNNTKVPCCRRGRDGSCKADHACGYKLYTPELSTQEKILLCTAYQKGKKSL